MDSRKFIRAADNVVVFGTEAIGKNRFSEMYMEWKESTGDPCLSIYYEGWHKIMQFCDVWQKLSKPSKENITIEQFIEILKECEFEDAGQTISKSHTIYERR